MCWFWLFLLAWRQDPHSRGSVSTVWPASVSSSSNNTRPSSSNNNNNRTTNSSNPANSSSRISSKRCQLLLLPHMAIVLWVLSALRLCWGPSVQVSSSLSFHSFESSTNQRPPGPNSLYMSSAFPTLFISLKILCVQKSDLRLFYKVDLSSAAP